MPKLKFQINKLNAEVRRTQRVLKTDVKKL